MKQPIYLILFVIFGIMACTETSDSPNMSEEDMTEDVISVKDTISVATFNQWTNAWDANQRGWLDTSKMTYFTLPIVDLTQVLAENAKGTRFYLGLESKRGNSYEAKLMLVGTDEKGSDLIDYENGNYIYDFSKLCPPFCDPTD